jgi:hypothetical protein
MAALERNDWINPPTRINDNVFLFFTNPPADNPAPPNVLNAYIAEVTNLKNQIPSPTGVVVSSDPFFRSTASDFVSAMSSLGVPICYPFQDFNPTPPNILLPNAAVLSSATSTDPNTAYYRLGLVAGAVLNATTASPLPSTKLDSSIWIENPVTPGSWLWTNMPI